MQNIHRRKMSMGSYIPQVQNTTYLYYLGDECTDITGGWVAIFGGAPYWSKEQVRFYIDHTNANSGSALYTNRAINISSYVKFGAYCRTFLKRYSTSIGYQIQLKNGLGYAQNIIFQHEPPYTANTIYLLNQDISFNSSLNIGLWTFRGNVGCYCIFLAKQDNISGLSTYGSTISQIISNAQSLLADQDAVKYMIYNCTGDFMWTALADSTFVSNLRASAYYSDIRANSEWGKALALLDN